MAEGGVTPQRDLQPRDMTQRNQAFRDFAEYERLNMGHGNQRRREIQELDREFFDEQHYDANLPHQMEDAAFSERNRIIEITGPFIDQTMERFTGKVTQVENSRIEHKHGQGPVGRFRRWCSDTVIGSRVHYGGKVALGVIAHGLSVAAPIAAPALNFIGTRMIADGFVEAIQKEGFEIPRIQRLEQLRLGRHYWVRELARLRNLYSGQSPVGDPYGRVDIVGTPLPAATIGATMADVGAPGVAAAMDSGALNSAQENHMAYPGPAGAPSAEYINPATNLNRRLEIIIEQAELLEVQIHRTEQELENIRRIGRTIRGVVGAAISAATIYELFTSGLSMGIQNFDSAIEVAKGLAPTSHEVFLTGHGVQFAYNAASEIGSATVNTIGGVAMHGVGTVAPWLQIGATVGGLVGSMAGSLAMDINAVRDHNANYHWYEDERNNPDGQAVLTFTGRTTNDFDNTGTSGVHHEIEHVSTMTSVRNSEEMNERKEIMIPGSVWQVPLGSLPPGIVPPPRVMRPTAGTVAFQVIRWEGQGLVMTFVTDDSIRNMKDGIVLGPRITVKNADSIIMDSRQEAGSLSEMTPQARIDKILEDRAEDLSANNNRVVRTAITIGGRTIPVGNYIELSRPKSDLGRVNVRELDAAGAAVGMPIVIDAGNLAALENILDNSERISNIGEAVKNVEKERNKRILTDINNIIQRHHPSNQPLRRGQFFKMGTTDEWLAVLGVDDEAVGGNIDVIVGTGFGDIIAPLPGGADPSDKEKKKRLNEKISTSSENRSYNFTNFRTFVDDGPAAGGVKTYTNKLEQQKISAS